METTVKYGQSFFDKVIECTGSINNLFEMALLNNISITEILTPGTVLKVSPVTNKNIVKLWKENNLPSTAITIIEHEPVTDYILPDILPLFL